MLLVNLREKIDESTSVKLPCAQVTLKEYTIEDECNIDKSSLSFFNNGTCNDEMSAVYAIHEWGENSTNLIHCLKQEKDSIQYECIENANTNIRPCARGGFGNIIYYKSKLFIFGGNDQITRYDGTRHKYHDLWCFDLKTKLWQEIKIKDKNGSVVSSKERKFFLFTRYKEYAIIFGGSDAYYNKHYDFNLLNLDNFECYHIFDSGKVYGHIEKQSQFVNNDILCIQTSSDNTYYSIDMESVMKYMNKNIINLNVKEKCNIDIDIDFVKVDYTRPSDYDTDDDDDKDKPTWMVAAMIQEFSDTYPFISSSSIKGNNLYQSIVAFDQYSMFFSRGIYVMNSNQWPQCLRHNEFEDTYKLIAIDSKSNNINKDKNIYNSFVFGYCLKNKIIWINNIKEKKDSKKTNHIVYSLDFIQSIDWDIERLLWIAFYKNCHIYSDDNNTDNNNNRNLCYLNQLPKDIIVKIIHLLEWYIFDI